jgi:hypothetical protein
MRWLVCCHDNRPNIQLNDALYRLSVVMLSVVAQMVRALLTNLGIYTIL